MDQNTKTPEVPQTTTSKKRRIVIGLAIALILGVGIVGGIAYLFTNRQAPAKNPATQQPAPAPETSYSNRAVYGEQTATVTSEERDFPVYKLWLQDENKERQLLGDFGGTDDYVYLYESLLHSKGERVFLRYDQHVSDVNIATKKVTTLWTAPAGMTVHTILESNDGSKLYVSAGTEFVNGNSKQRTVIDEIDLATNKKKTLFDGPHASVRLMAERSDKKLVTTVITYSEFTKYTVFDITSQAFTTSTDVNSFAVSRNGLVGAIPADTVINACNALSGQSPTSIQLVDPNTKKLGQKITTNNKSARATVLNDDGSKVLLETRPISKAPSCIHDQQPKPEYLVYSTNDKKLSPVASKYKGYAMLFPGKPYLDSDMKNKTCYVYLNEDVIATTTCETFAAYTPVGAVKVVEK